MIPLMTVRTFSLAALLLLLSIVSADARDCALDRYKYCLASAKNTDEALALLDTVNSSNFEEFRKQFSDIIMLFVANEPVSFGRNYDSFQWVRADLHRRQDLIRQLHPPDPPK